MPPGLPIRLHYGPPSRNASSRWPKATLGDLSLLQSSVSIQTNAAVIRGMERTMDVMGNMAHRAGPCSGARSSSLRLTVGEAQVILPPFSSLMEAHPERRIPSSPLEWIVGATNMGGSGLTASEGVEGMQELSKSPQIPTTMPLTFGGNPETLEGQTARRRSNTDIRRKPVLNLASPSGHSIVAAKPNPRDSGNGIFVPIGHISADTIATMMVAAKLSTPPSSLQYTIIPEYQEGRASRRRATFRKDLKQWLGSDIASLSNIMDHPAFAHEVEMQEGMQCQWLIPPLLSTELDPARACKGRQRFRPCEGVINLRDIAVAESGNVEAKSVRPPLRGGHRAIKSIPSVPEDSSFENEHASRLEMLQRRRQNADRPASRDSNAEYPDEEEMKAIQRDIRARTVKGWMKQERRGTWYGYVLGF